jgi:hypothetical protein
MEPDPLVYPTELDAVGEPLPRSEPEEPSSRLRAWLRLRWLRRSATAG